MVAQSLIIVCHKINQVYVQNKVGASKGFRTIISAGFIIIRVMLSHMSTIVSLFLKCKVLGICYIL